LTKKISKDMKKWGIHEEIFALPILPSSIYHISVLIGGKQGNLMKSIDAAFDTCASCYIIRCDILPIGVAILPCENKPHLVDANGAYISFEGVATVRLQVGGLSMLIEFLVTKRVSVPVILGTSFIDEHVEAILPHERRIILRYMSEVYIGPDTAEVSTVKLAKDYCVPASSEFFVAVVS
jgi:hypothetical protein